MRKLAAALVGLFFLIAPAALAGLYESGGPGSGPVLFSFSSGSNSFNTSTTLYWPAQGSGMVGQSSNFGSSAQVLVTAPFPGLLRNLSCLVGTALTSTQQLAITAEAGPSASTLTCTINSSSTCSSFSNSLCTVAGRGCEDVTHVWPVNKGDLIDFKTVPTNSPTTSPISCSAQLEPLGGSNPIPQVYTFVKANSGAAIVNNADSECPVIGADTASSTGCQGSASAGFIGQSAAFPGVLRNLRLVTATALTSTQTLQGTVIVAGSSTALTCTIDSTGMTDGPCTGQSAGKCCYDTTHAATVNAWQGVRVLLHPTNTPNNSSGYFQTLEFDPAGGVSPTIPVYTKSADYTITAADLAQAQEVVFLCSTASSRTMTLPAASAAPWKKIVVKRQGANICTVSRAGSDTLYDGAAVNSRDLTVDGESISLISDGVSSWALH